jgi:threonine dehydrogenase-like Zn-dependent dehydrogenase
MRQVKFLGNSRIAVVDAPDPRPKENEVLVKLRASGICGSELHSYRSEKGLPSNGGHEVTGEVVEAPARSKLRPGDRVGIHAVWGCGECEWCQQGKYTYCQHRSGGLSGCHADLMTTPDHCCLKLPPDVPDDVGVLLTGDGLGVPYHCSLRMNTKGGDFVLVMGAGPIGLGNVLMQSFRGAEVIAVDIVDERLKLARDLGARHVLNSKAADVVAAVREITQGVMCAATINSVGVEEGLRTCIRCAAVRGDIMNLGGVTKMTLDISGELVYRDLSLMGSWFYHYSEFAEMVKLYRRGLRVAKLITHRFPLAQADQAYKEFVAGATGKVILVP